jgi:hypothetical protein
MFHIILVEIAQSGAGAVSVSSVPFVRGAMPSIFGDSG